MWVRHMHKALSVRPGRQEGGSCEGEVGFQRGVAVDRHSLLQGGSDSYAASAALLEQGLESGLPPSHPYSTQSYVDTADLRGLILGA